MPGFPDLQGIVEPCIWLAFIFAFVGIVAIIREDIVSGGRHKQLKQDFDAITTRYQDLTDHVFKVKEARESAKTVRDNKL